MARKLKSFTFTHAFHRKYPWEKWLDGSYWVLKYGADFRCGRENFKTAVHLAAKTRGLDARTQWISDSEIVIQAVKRAA